MYKIIRIFIPDYQYSRLSFSRKDAGCRAPQPEFTCFLDNVRRCDIMQLIILLEYTKGEPRHENRYESQAAPP